MTTFTTQDRQDAERDWDAYEYMCPNCLTPWKCNGPHIEQDAQRTPLSEFEIKGILAQGECWIGEDSSMPNLLAFARAIERAHGIGE